MLLGDLPIRIKLALLAGIPVLGALLLSALIARDAQERAATAAALGSIEDLAELSQSMSSVVADLQSERAHTARSRGANSTAPDSELVAARAATDESVRRLESFLLHVDVSHLPTRLSRGLASARAQLGDLPSRREGALGSNAEVMATLEFFRGATETLIGAGAALTELSDDGDMLRSISSLVATQKLAERASREHALLSYVFHARSFPPGAYRSFVTNVTEEELFAEVLQTNADDATNTLFRQQAQSDVVTHTNEMRQRAIETMDDEYGVEPATWFQAQETKIEGLRKVQHHINEQVRSAANRKIAQTRQAIYEGMGLAAAVLFVSVILALLIGKGVYDAVAALSLAAVRVRDEKDFGVRAVKRSNDELGTLTDAFNAMLAGIGERDEELGLHRSHLEQMVRERTDALSRRNDEMRLVLDNVPLGLVTIARDGTLAQERSAAFAAWFGKEAESPHFWDHLASEGPSNVSLRMGWEQLMEGTLPIELCLDQLPTTLTRGRSHYAIGFTPMHRSEVLEGALMTVSDVTAEVVARQAEAEQREFLSVFERAVKDKRGFIEFFSEVQGLLRTLESGGFEGPDEVARAVHTMKGNCSIFHLESVAHAAHELESYLARSDDAVPPAHLVSELGSRWRAFVERVTRLIDTDPDGRVEVTREELDALLDASRARAPHTHIVDMLERLKYEEVEQRFHRVGQQACSLALRLGKPEPEISVDADQVRLPPTRWGAFWTAFVHVVRNAMDHGIESPEDREAAGKSREGHIRFAARTQDSELVLEISDDGRGIDWEGVRAAARSRGLPHGDRNALVAALFSSGLSTRTEVTQLSGRGIGMGAIRSACEGLGGRVEVESHKGLGTTLRFCFPLAQNRCSLPPPIPSRIADALEAQAG